jgi:SAM-dependent methyltransferase
MEEAARLDREAGVSVRYVEAAAEETGLEATRFDLVIAGQCWHWFDRPRAAAEARRLLRTGGHLLICHFDWIPLPANLADTTEKLIQKHNPKWTLAGGMGLYPQWLGGLVQAGFSNLETFSFDLDVPYSHESWRGRIRASAGVGASLPPEGVPAFDAELKALMAERYPEDPVPVLHRVFAAIATAP